MTAAEAIALGLQPASVWVRCPKCDRQRLVSEFRDEKCHRSCSGVFLDPMVFEAQRHCERTLITKFDALCERVRSANATAASKLSQLMHALTLIERDVENGTNGDHSPADKALLKLRKHWLAPELDKASSEYEAAQDALMAHVDDQIREAAAQKAAEAAQAKA